MPEPETPAHARGPGEAATHLRRRLVPIPPMRPAPAGQADTLGRYPIGLPLATAGPGHPWHMIPPGGGAGLRHALPSALQPIASGRRAVRLRPAAQSLQATGREAGASASRRQVPLRQEGLPSLRLPPAAQRLPPSRSPLRRAEEGRATGRDAGEPEARRWPGGRSRQAARVRLAPNVTNNYGAGAGAGVVNVATSHFGASLRHVAM